MGASYTAFPALTGGTGPFTYSISAGTLPAGLAIVASSGVISGTPTAKGSSAVTVRVVDGFGQSATANGTIVIGAPPALGNPPLPTGDVGVAYSQQLVVTGGGGPFAWSVPTGSLPVGVTLGSSTGTLTGTPGVGGSFPFTVQVTDGFGLSATQPLILLIRGASSVSLAASTASVGPGGSVGLTGTVTPSSATGTVTFTDTIISGPNAGSSQIIGSAPVGAGGIAQSSVALAAFGAHSIVASYGGDSGNVASASSPTVVQVVGTAGSLIVSEFRLSGPAGPADQYVELTNVSTGPVALGGFQLALSSGAVTTIPNWSSTRRRPCVSRYRAWLFAGRGRQRRLRG